MNWKIGQKLVCISEIDFIYTHPFAPKQDEIVTIHAFSKYTPGFIQLSEYLIGFTGRPMFVNPKYFRPLLGQSATAELVSSFIEITETSDLPIRSPQPTEPCGS